MAGGLDALNKLYLPTTGGGQTPLSSVVTPTVGAGRLVINRQGQFPAATVSFDVAQGKALGDAVEAVGEVTAALGMDRLRWRFHRRPSVAGQPDRTGA